MKNSHTHLTQKLFLFLLIILSAATTQTIAQNCNFAAPVITTDFTSQCILYDDKHDPIPDPNNCWKVCENGQVGYNVLPVAGNSYVWTVGGGA